MRPNISNCHALPGTLIIFEGADGSWKTTQIEMLKKLLNTEGHKVKISDWKSSSIIGGFLSQNEALMKVDERILPETNLFLQAADLLYRIEREIIPALKLGQIVIMDRWVETLLVRGLMIGMNEDQLVNGLFWWKNTIYKELFDKAITIHIAIDLDTSLARLRKRAIKNIETTTRWKRGKAEWTLLALDFINSLIYSPEWKKMTRSDKKLFAKKTQEKIINFYNIVMTKNEKHTININGICSKRELPAILKRQIIDVIL